jgi:anti-anti-sigma factor
VGAADVDVHGHDPGEALVAVSGEIDLTVRDELQDTLSATIDEPGVTKVVVDLSRVSFMDSTGLHVLLTARERAQSAGVGFRVVGATGLVERVLAVTGVLELLTGELPDLDEPVAPWVPADDPSPPDLPRATTR